MADANESLADENQSDSWNEATSTRRKRTEIFWSGLLIGFAALCWVTVFFSQRYMDQNWGGGNFPPLVGHLCVILVGGVMLVGLATSTVGTLVAAWNLAKLIRQQQHKQALIALALLIVGVIVMVSLNLSIR